MRADDVMQRLIVADRSRQTSIRLEYQLGGYGKLRDIVLQRTDPSTRLSGGRLFHRTVINKVVIGVFGLMFGAAALMALYQGSATSAFFAGLSALSAFVITRDPNSLQIRRSSVVIRFPGWERSITFDDITEIGSEDQA